LDYLRQALQQGSLQLPEAELHQFWQKRWQYWLPDYALFTALTAEICRRALDRLAQQLCAPENRKLWLP
jgi:hypothetical protein